MQVLRRPLLTLTLFCALLYLPGLSALPPIDRDEARFAQASKQMLESGNWVVPYFQEEPRSKKPVGIYWLQASALLLLSDQASREIWVYRLPSALAAWFAVLLTYAVGVRLFDRRSALLGAALLAASLLLNGEAHLATSDAVLLATILLSIWGLAQADRRPWPAPARAVGAISTEGFRESARESPAGSPGGPPHRLAWLAFWAGLGTAALIKGPVGPAVLGLAVLGLRAFRGQWPAGRDLRPAAGLALFLVIAGLWPAALALKGELGFIARSANEDLIPKLLSGQESHGAPPGSYLLALYPAFWPASLLVVPAMFGAWARRHDRGVGFCLAWALPAWLLFALVPTKLPHYVLPVYPALALLAAAAVVQAWPPPRSGPWRWLFRLHVLAWTLLGTAGAGALLYLPWHFAEGGLWWSLPATAITLLGSA